MECMEHRHETSTVSGSLLVHTLIIYMSVSWNKLRLSRVLNSNKSWANFTGD